jgi:hypothetical protein
MGIGGLHAHHGIVPTSSLEVFGLRPEESCAMKIIRRTVIGVSTLGLFASLLPNHQF